MSALAANAARLAMQAELTASELQSLYPGMSLSVAQAAERVRRGQNVDWNRFHVRRRVFSHKLALLVNGAVPSSLANNTAVFFGGQGPSPFVCDWYGGNGLPSDHVAFVRAVRLKAVIGEVFADGTADTASIEIQGGANYVATALTTQAFVRWLTQAGYVTLKIGDRLHVEAAGVETFPAGKGYTIDTALAGTAAASNAQVHVGNNGVPHSSNSYELAPWAPILPQKPVTLQVQWQTLASGLILTAVDISLRAELDTILLSPANS